jgi:putative ABC transport system permease protein
MKFWRSWKRRKDRESDLEREFRDHLELEAEEQREAGVSAEEAAFAARRALGNDIKIKEDVRMAWGYQWLETFLQDVRYGLRQLHRNPGFTIVAVLTLALGIGGITAIFSAFYTVLIRPLPYADADRLVMVWDDMNKSEGDSTFFSTPAEWTEWRRLNTVFTDLACSQPGNAILSGDGEPEEVRARRVTWNLWTVLGVPPALGRGFTQEEDDRGARVVVMSYGIWQRRFGGASDIVGRKIFINDEAYEVVGVMPRSFYFMPARDIDMWMPASFPPGLRGNFTWHNAQIVARLKPGVTLEHARQSMGALSLQVTAKDFRGPHSVTMMPLREQVAGKTRTALIVLLWASAALLLIACVNVANLMLSRSAVRRREVAVRAALGAGRGRLIAQFLTESLVFAGLGAVAGLALAVPAMRLLEQLVPEAMGAARLTLDWRVLGFAAIASVAAALAFGLAPALRGARLSPQDGLRDGGRGTAGARSHWFQNSLTVLETALAVALLICGGLLLETLEHLWKTDLGISTEWLLTFETPLLRYNDFEGRVAFVNAELAKVRAIPGVTNAGAISRIPLTVTDNSRFYLLAGQSPDSVSKQIALTRVVSQGYFTTVGARLREGRFFETSDQKSESPVVVVSESFANRNYSGRSPLGERLKFERLNEKGYWYTIVGVVREIRERGVAEDSRPAIYRVHEQADQSNDLPSGIVVRTAVEPASTISAVRQAIWSVDKNQPLARVRTMKDIVDRQLSTPTESTALLGALAVLALLLASVGIYGVLSYAVTQRTKEIGVRMALGATSRDILLSFGGRGLALTLLGLALGLALAAIAARSMTALLYGFRPDYVPTATVASLILLAVAAAACFLPAHRASRVDPMVALRHE